MTLPFQTHWPKHMGDLAGKPTNFVPMIWNCFTGVLEVDEAIYSYYYNHGVNGHWMDIHQLKIHTIREDKHERWREGMDIHFVINNRTKDRYQFMPVIKCTGVQEIQIEMLPNNRVLVFIDGRKLTVSEMVDLAKNDGFPGLPAFYAWGFFDCNNPFKGRIIHWTDKRY